MLNLCALIKPKKRNGTALLEAGLMLPIIVLVFVFLAEMIFVFTIRSVMYVAASEGANLAMTFTRGLNPTNPSLGYGIESYQANQICDAVVDMMDLMNLNHASISITIYDVASRNFTSGRCKVIGGGVQPGRILLRVNYTHDWLHARMLPISAPSIDLAVEVTAFKQMFEGSRQQ